jgi:hypothetical protein
MSSAPGAKTCTGALSASAYARSPPCAVCSAAAGSAALPRAIHGCFSAAGALRRSRGSRQMSALTSALASCDTFTHSGPLTLYDAIAIFMNSWRARGARQRAPAQAAGSTCLRT